MESGGVSWRLRYSRRLSLWDGVVVIWATAGALLVRFGLDDDYVLGSPNLAMYWALSILLSVLWWIMLGLWGSRDTKILGAGAEEYKRILAASLWLFGSLAIVSYAFRMELARGYVALAFPSGLVGLTASRWIIRQHLGMERANGISSSRLLVLGGPAAVSHLVDSLEGLPAAGYRPIAAYLPNTSPSSTTTAEIRVPIMGHAPDTDSILRGVEECGADCVAISAGVQLHPTTIRHLGWELATRDIGLIVAPALTDIAGPRIHTQPVAGLPLIHVTTPKLVGAKRAGKRLFDMCASAAMIAILAPLMVVIALLVKLDSSGPIVFKQQRVGIQGEPFVMYKFRSMAVDAERQLAALASQNEGNGVLFKMRDDPRVTKIGALLRRFSLDELPQLFNVLQGAMSLVGPRPPLISEVDSYEKHVRRRLLVKPGLTGLWQVSGRSNLSWQDSVRLDLYYVENWSMTGDILILLKTARAVLYREGAY